MATGQADQLTDSEFKSALSEAVVSVQRSTGWTNIQSAKLGNSENPPVVIVPPAQAQQPGMFYCYSIIDGTKNVYQVLNTYPGLTYDNATAETPIRIGYPPKSNTYAIYDLDPAVGLTFTGGAQPNQIQQIQSMFATPDRFAMLRLSANEADLTLSLTDGWVRFGVSQLAYIPANTAFVDMTTYVPTTSGESCYCLIGVDETGAAVVTAGSTFPTSTTEPATYIPTTLQSGVCVVGAVYLAYGTTAVAQGNIINIPDIFNVPVDTSSSTSSSVAVAEVLDSEPPEPIAGQFWLDSAGSLPDTLNLRDSDNTDWNLFVELGSGTKPFSRAFVQQAGYTGTMSAYTISGGVVTFAAFSPSNIRLEITSETGTADDLDTITFPDNTGYFLLLQATATHTITLKHATGNIFFNSATDQTLSGDKACLILRIPGGGCFGFM